MRSRSAGLPSSAPTGPRRGRPARALAGIAAVALVAVAVVPAASLPAAAQPGEVRAAETGAARAAAADMDALTVLPPGNSMRYTLDGQVLGTLTGDPGDFGDHVDDQREMYWDYQFKDGRFRDECADPVVLRAGARYCLDDHGVPAVYGDSAADVWYAAGYAVAQQRLFLLDAVRRTARGTLSELTGPDGVPADVEARVHGYTEAELDAFYDRLSTEARTAVDSYIDGVNDYIGDVLGPRLDELPAEYVLLTSLPQPIDHRDVLAAGVLMTREVAAEGGTEMANVAALRALEEEFGVEEGRAIFQDLVWVEDGEATVTVPRDEGVFPRTTADADQRAAAFDAMADFAAEVPLELATGPGTGHAPPPTPIVDDLAGLSSAGGPDLAAVLEAAGLDATDWETLDWGTADPVSQAQAAIEEWRTALSGGSFLAVIAPEKTADGSALLVSQPQLGYDPTLLVELEIHGGGYTARGSTVPGLPVVGIGYTDRVAWAVTTGNSKTVDSFIEETRRTDQGDLEYRHDGEWKPAECRTESVGYRFAAEGVPAGPDLFSYDVEVCRTVHGPIVAMTEDETAARSVQYHMWQRETETVEGVLAWNRAKDLDDFEAAMRLVTWNENTGYVDADGRIAFWHPGLHHVRDPRTDLRLPAPGTGEYDLGDHLPFEALPHAVDPAQGFLANWNNKPAHGWLDGVGMSYTSYPAGRGQRVTNVIDAIDARDDWTFEALRDLDRYAAEHDMRATEFLPLLLDLRDRDDLSDLQAAALDLLAGWDGSANGPGADMRFELGSTATVGAANTVFEAVLDALLEDLLSPVALEAHDLVARQQSSGRHVYDVSPALNLVLRIVDPSASTLTPSRDYLRGRTAEEALLDAVSAGLADLGVDDAGDLDGLRRSYRMERVCSPTGGIIGPCVEMPFLERGTWIHLTGFATTAAGPGDDDRPPTPADDTDEPTPADGSGRRPLPATGGGAIGLAMLAFAGAALLRRPTATR